MSADLILLLIAVAGFSAPAIGTGLHEAGYERLSNLDIAPLVLAVVAAIVFAPVINEGCYGFKGYAGLYLGFITTLMVFIVIPTIISVGIFAFALPYLFTRMATPKPEVAPEQVDVENVPPEESRATPLHIPSADERPARLN